MSAPVAVVFDLGNVLLGWQPEAYYDAKIGTARASEFFDAVPIEEVSLRSDAGESLEELITALAADYPAWQAEIMMWWTDWPKICAPAIEGSVDILKRLKADGVPLFTLTNFGAETFEIARQAYPFLDLFDAHFVSAHHKVMKPEPDFYRILEAQTGYSGDEIIFADDRANNIETAKSLGWRAHQFVTPEGWEIALRQAGLLGGA